MFRAVEYVNAGGEHLSFGLDCLVETLQPALIKSGVEVVIVAVEVSPQLDIKEEACMIPNRR